MSEESNDFDNQIRKRNEYFKEKHTVLYLDVDRFEIKQYCKAKDFKTKN